MDLIRKKDGIMALKITATLCFGRFSGLVSYGLGDDPHPAKTVEKTRGFLPITALIGSACSMSVIFLCKKKHRPRETFWFLMGTIPLGMALSQPVIGYVLRDVSEADWYKFKRLRSLVAFGVFAVCAINIGYD
eukprot:TCONS_00030454-protein